MICLHAAPKRAVDRPPVRQVARRECFACSVPRSRPEPGRCHHRRGRIREDPTLHPAQASQRPVERGLQVPVFIAQRWSEAGDEGRRRPVYRGNGWAGVVCGRPWLHRRALERYRPFRAQETDVDNCAGAGTATDKGAVVAHGRSHPTARSRMGILTMFWGPLPLHPVSARAIPGRASFTRRTTSGWRLFLENRVGTEVATLAGYPRPSRPSRHRP
jgi:hypothetical protein